MPSGRINVIIFEDEKCSLPCPLGSLPVAHHQVSPRCLDHRLAQSRCSANCWVRDWLPEWASVSPSVNEEVNARVSLPPPFISSPPRPSLWEPGRAKKTGNSGHAHRSEEGPAEVTAETSSCRAGLHVSFHTWYPSWHYSAGQEPCMQLLNVMRCRCVIVGSAFAYFIKTINIECIIICCVLC